MLEKIGVLLQTAGFKLLPVSIVGYFIVGFLTYKWEKRYYAKLLKTIWYILQIILTVTRDAKVETVAVTILAFEAFDALLDYYEGKKYDR